MATGKSTESDPARRGPSLRGHIAIARFDHWVKNVFVFPGILIAVVANREAWTKESWLDLLLGLISIGLIASSNYVLNELIDAPFDREHPMKRKRPVPSGRVHVPLGYAQWIVLMLAGLAVGRLVSPPFAGVMAALWIMGCVYNIPPVRSKDRPFIDVLSEALNNPIRLLAGWYIVDPGVVIPVSLVVAYWMIGCYLMALKRFAELRTIADGDRAARYRRSFSFYNESNLLISVMFYASTSMLFFGAFLIRYRMELILSFPLIALFMAVYLRLALKPDSPVPAPEKLYTQKSLMITGALCMIVITLLFFVDIPMLDRIFAPTILGS